MYDRWDTERLALAYDNRMWKILAKHAFRIDVKLLFEMNATFADLQSMLKAKLNSFWRDVLKVWCNYNYKNPLDTCKVTMEVTRLRF